MQFSTYSGSVNAGVIINFSSYNASSITKSGLVKAAYIYIHTYIHTYTYIYIYIYIYIAYDLKED